MGEMKFPIKVQSIKWDAKAHHAATLTGAKCGDAVAVRPCGEQYGDKTYLGIMLGEFPLSQMASFNKKTGELSISLAMHNPAIFVPDLNEIIWGCGSFWKRINSADDLKMITDADIQGVWYMRALKGMSEQEGGK